MRFDGFHHPTEDLLGNLLRRALFPQQFVQVIVSEILVGKLQERLAGLLAKPKRGSLGQAFGPVHMVQEPWGCDILEVSRRGRID